MRSPRGGFRDEWGASWLLVGFLGADVAEEATQDASATAAERWPGRIADESAPGW